MMMLMEVMSLIFSNSFGYSMIKLKVGGCKVETMFNGSKLEIEPYLVDVSPIKELLVLDNENSNICKI